MKKIILLGIILLFTSCSTVSGLRRNESKGVTFTVTGKEFKQVWGSAISTVNRKMILVYSDRNRGIIKAETTPGIGTWGEVVGIFIEKNENNSFSINVQSYTRSKLQISGQNWENYIVANMKNELEN